MDNRNDNLVYHLPDGAQANKLEQSMRELQSSIDQHTIEQRKSIDADQAIKLATERPSVFGTAGNIEKQPFANTPNYPDCTELFIKELGPNEAAEQTRALAAELRIARQESNLTQDDFNLAA